MSAQVKHLVEQGKVYALQEHQQSSARQQHDGRRSGLQQHEGRRSGRISITEDGKLCLHHLMEEPLPPNVHVVDVSLYYIIYVNVNMANRVKIYECTLKFDNSVVYL